MPRRLSLSGLVLALGLCAHAGATDLRLYSTFAEVREPVTLTASGGTAAHRLTFTREAWSLVQPGSLSFFGAPLVRIQTLPTDLDWLTTQEGQAVKVLRTGQPALDGTLVRAPDLLVRLVSGEFLNVRRDELAFTSPPPLDWFQGGVAARFEVAGQGQVSGEVSYRTQALSWSPLYELEAAGAQARLAALAEIRNLGGEAFDARQVDLFAGDVRTFAVAGQTGAAQATPAPPPLPTAGTAHLSVATRPVTSAGELRGLQRYTLAGGLKLDRGETLTVPFVQPKITGFTRYDSISTYFDPQERQGRASRHYKFTPDTALPSGPLSVREEGVPVGAVLLPAAQAGRAVDLDLGAWGRTTNCATSGGSNGWARRRTPPERCSARPIR